MKLRNSQLKTESSARKMDVKIRKEITAKKCSRTFVLDGLESLLGINDLQFWPITFFI